MPKVKESKKTRMVVVPYDPKRKFLRFALVLLLLSASFAAGFVLSNRDYFEVREQRDLLVQELADANRANKEHQRRVAQLQIGSNVDQEATNQVRESMADLRKQIADLKSEISFYKGLMAPKDSEEGVSIRSLDLLATSNPRKYQFKMVLQQFANQHRLVSGNVRVSILGQQNGKEVILSLSDLSPDIADEKIKYRFKYFQNIEGAVTLPDNYEPKRIDVLVKGSGGRSVYLEKKFGWLTQEA